LVLWPRKDGELTAFVRWLTHTHTMRWHAHYHTMGAGHLTAWQERTARRLGLEHTLRRRGRPNKVEQPRG
jgi:hypothetical protein